MRLTGLIDPVQHFVDLLTLQFGIDLPSGLSHGVKQWTEAAIGRVHCDKAMVRPLEANQNRRDVLENASYILGRTDRFVPVHFGRHLAVPPTDRCSKRVNVRRPIRQATQPGYQRALPACRKSKSAFGAGRHLCR
ncbi:Uncharacterised protein [Mycobacterium tuberculosis]|nr:Uncharacterised protein [Mycobacterium tuberculosis]